MISNKRIYANPNSYETAQFEYELEKAGIEYYRHDPGITWTDNTTLFGASAIVYTFNEEDFDKAQAIIDKIRENQTIE